MPKTFIGYVFSLKLILWTIIINLGAFKFYYSVFNEPDTWFVGKGIIVALTIFVTAILTGFWFLAYKEFRSKNNQNTNFGK